MDNLRVFFSSLRFRVVFSHLFVILFPFFIVGITANYIMQKDAIEKETNRLMGEIRAAETYINEILHNSQQFNASFMSDESLIRDATDLVRPDQISRYSDIVEIQNVYSTMASNVSTNRHVKSIYFYNFATGTFFLATDRTHLAGQIDDVNEKTFNSNRINIYATRWHQDFALKRANHRWLLTNPIEEGEDHILAYTSLVSLARRDVFALISSNIRESEIRAVLQRAASASQSQAYLIDSDGEILSTTQRDVLKANVRETDLAALFSAEETTPLDDTDPYAQPGGQMIPEAGARGGVGSQTATGTAIGSGSGTPAPGGTIHQLVTRDGYRHLAVGQYSEEGRLFLIVTPYSYILNATKQYRTVVILLYLSVALLSIVSLIFVGRLLLNPITELVGAMRGFKEGDFGVRLPQHRNDEIGYIYSQFNEMVESVSALIHENYVMELERKNASMKLIQTQIKRHFLFNTLDLINWNVLKGDRESASNALLALSGFYRISLTNGEDLITVREAADMLKLYAEIVELRYPGMFRFDISVNPAIEDAKVLKFIFQPLLENAFVHGVSKSGQGVGVRFESVPAGVAFTVTDDGRGIPPDRLKQIQDALDREDGEPTGGFALVNVNRHVQLYYGEDVRLHIESTWGQGTTVSVTIPLPVRDGDV